MAFRTIVKHSYVPAGRDALARMKAHVRYIKHRPGHDIQKKERSFFNGRKGEISKTIVIDALEKVSKSDPVAAHKLILSPGVPDVDIETYVRSVMNDISRAKGQELTWFAVKHENTTHAHAHVVVMPRDQLGHRVRFTKTDYQTIKTVGDNYLVRTKSLSRERDEQKYSESKSKLAEFLAKLKTAVKEAYLVLKNTMQPETEEVLTAQSVKSARRDDSTVLGYAPASWQLKIKREIRAEHDKARAWREFAKPISIREGFGRDFKPLTVEYNAKTPLRALRRLEKRYLAGAAGVADQMTEQDYERLKTWIKSQFKEQKIIERSTEALKNIRAELSAETIIDINPKSEKQDLLNLKMKHLKGDINLTDVEYKALSNWLIERKSGEKSK